MKALIGILLVAAMIGCGGADTAGPQNRFVVTMDSCATASITVTMNAAAGGGVATESLTVAASRDSAAFASLSAGQYDLELVGSWPGVSGRYATLLYANRAVTVPGRQTIVCSGGRPAPYVVKLVGAGGCLLHFAVGQGVSDGAIVSGVVVGGLSGGPSVSGVGVTGSTFVNFGDTTRDTVFLPRGSYAGGATVFASYSDPDWFGYNEPQLVAPVPDSVSLSC